MQIHQLVQGSPEWDQFRLTHKGASEAAAALGISPTTTRTELLQVKKSGIAKEFSDFVQKRVLDKGHAVEALARPIVEKLIDDDLFPVTCSRGDLSASCDGLTMDRQTAFEHKQWNEELATQVANGIVPEHHMAQCQQILLVTGAKKVIFVVSNGTESSFMHTNVLPDEAWFERIERGWEQFDADLADFVPPEVPVKIVAEPVEALPAPVVTVTGELALQDNFKVFEQRLRDFLANRLIREPKTDEDFVNLDAQIKAMKQGREALKASKAQMLAQVQPIDQASKTADMLDSLLQQNVSMAEKLLTAEKDRRKGEIVADGVAKLREHIAGLNARLGKPYMPTIPADFGGAVKGLKSLASMEDKVSGELARAKIAANEVADKIDANLKFLRDNAAAHTFLFHDAGTIVLKAADDLQTLVRARIAEHDAAEEKKREAERERIRAEEHAKLQREALAEQQAKEAEARKTAEAAIKTAATPAPAPTPTVRVTAVPEAGISIVTKPAPADEKPTLNLGAINTRLGFIVTADFLASLGFPAHVERNAKLYRESDWPRICEAIVQHLYQVADTASA